MGKESHDKESHEMDAPAVSVVVPVYNEEASVEPLVARTTGVLGEAGVPFELILVDDGSTDASVERVRALMAAHPQLRLIRLRRNSGQTVAMEVGFKAARGRVVVSMDGDLQNEPADIPRLVAMIDEGYDVVCGWRKNRHDKLWTRKVPSRVANWLIARLTGIPVHDNGCSLKAYRKTVLDRVHLYAEQHRFIPARAGMVGARIGEIVVTHHPRLHGQSKYGLSRIWKVFLDLFVIKMLTGFAGRPLWWFTLLSIPFAVLAAGFLVAAYLVSVRDGTATVLLTEGVLFSFAAVQMLMVGMMGEHIVQIGRDGRGPRVAAVRADGR
jgi:glycosyltransferase involved in cell wall biosynthesis